MSPSPQKKTAFLLTGVTGGLGSSILEFLLTTHSIPPSSIITTSRSNSSKQRFESRGLKFRIADYKSDPVSLSSAFTNVENVLFVSSSERDNAVRNTEHENVIEAAKMARVGKVWYVSLALGGLGNSSEIGFQQAHYETERLLVESGLEFTSLRAGLYAEAFPLFLNWYPSSRSVFLPHLQPPSSSVVATSSGQIALTTRDEIAEGIATLLAKGLPAFPSLEPQTERNIIPLTASSTVSFPDIVDAINRARSSSSGTTALPIEYLSPEEWITASATEDVGGKGRAWFEARWVFMQGIAKGDADFVDDSLDILLGRKSETGVDAVERLVRGDEEYSWHQNHV